MADFQQNGLNVTIKDVEEGKAKLITFWGIRPNDIDDIVKRLSLIGAKTLGQGDPEKGVRKVWRRGMALFVMIDNGEGTMFLDKGLKSVQAVLLKSGKYDTEEVMHLTDMIGFKFDTLSKADMDKLYKDAKVSEIDMWREYLSKINDPEVRKVLELYAKIYGNTSYGHMLSLANVITIKNINPNATFVLGASSWKNYDRGVKSGAKKYPLWGAKTVKEASQADIEAAQEALGHGLADFSDLGVAVQDAILKQASQEASNHKWVPFRYIGYDIADTYRIHPNSDDPLQSKPSIVSNITRELNALANEAEAKKKADMEGEDALKGHNEMVERTEKAVDEMEKICAENNVKCETNDSSSPSTKLVNMLIDYYSTQIPSKANVLHPSKVREYAMDCAQLTLEMDQIGLDELNRFSHSLVYTQAEAAALAPVIKKVVPRLGRAMANISEAIDFDAEWTKDSFLRKMVAAMKKLGIKIIKGNSEIESNTDNAKDKMDAEQFTESFNAMFKRINSVII